MPWPENLIRNIAKNNIKVDDMVEKKKLVAFPKDLMSEVVYGAESRLMEWMRKNGIIQYEPENMHSRLDPW